MISNSKPGEKSSIDNKKTPATLPSRQFSNQQKLALTPATTNSLKNSNLNFQKNDESAKTVLADVGSKSKINKMTILSNPTSPVKSNPVATAPDNKVNIILNDKPKMSSRQAAEEEKRFVVPSYNDIKKQAAFDSMHAANENAASTISNFAQSNEDEFDVFARDASSSNEQALDAEVDVILNRGSLDNGHSSNNTQQTNEKKMLKLVKSRCFSEPSSFHFLHNNLSLLSYSSFYLNSKYINTEMLENSPALQFLLRISNNRSEKAHESGRISSTSTSTRSDVSFSIQDLLSSYRCTLLAYKRSFSHTSMKLVEKRSIVKKSSSFEKFLKNIVKGKRKSNSFCNFGNSNNGNHNSNSDSNIYARGNFKANNFNCLAQRNKI